MTDHKTPPSAPRLGQRHDRNRGHRMLGTAAALALASGLAGCGSGDGEPGTSSSPSEDAGETSSATPSPTSETTDVADPGVLDGKSPVGSVKEFAARDECVNGSDYYYVLTVFSGANPPTFEPDAAFAQASLGRMNNLAEALSNQVPPAQRKNAEGAVKTWKIGTEAFRETGYDADSVEGFFNVIAPKIESFIPGNAALVKYLNDTCSTKVAGFGTKLTPPN